MTDDEIRTVYHRIKAAATYYDPKDYHMVVLILSDLSSIPYARVYEVCIEED